MKIFCNSPVSDPKTELNDFKISWIVIIELREPLWRTDIQTLQNSNKFSIEFFYIFGLILIFFCFSVPQKDNNLFFGDFYAIYRKKNFFSLFDYDVLFEIVEDIVGAEMSVLFFEIVNHKFFVFGGRHLGFKVLFLCSKLLID